MEGGILACQEKENNLLLGFLDLTKDQADLVEKKPEGEGFQIGIATLSDSKGMRYKEEATCIGMFSNNLTQSQD